MRHVQDVSHLGNRVFGGSYVHGALRPSHRAIPCRSVSQPGKACAEYSGAGRDDRRLLEIRESCADAAGGHAFGIFEHLPACAAELLAPPRCAARRSAVDATRGGETATGRARRRMNLPPCVLRSCCPKVLLAIHCPARFCFKSGCKKWQTVIAAAFSSHAVPLRKKGRAPHVALVSVYVRIRFHGPS